MAPGDAENLLKVCREEKACAVMLEVIQGEGGVNVLDKDYVRTVSDICQKEDLILIIDEIQTGNGRTGQLYGYMNYGIKPDIFTTAKGIGGGLPLGATVLGEKVKDIFSPGDNGSTFGGNPVCCAGALNILSRMDEQFLSEVRRKGDLVKDMLSGKSGVLSVSGMGLMIGIETVRPAAEAARECIKEGVLLLTAKEKLRLLPALNIPDEQLIWAVEKIIKVLGQEA